MPRGRPPEPLELAHLKNTGRRNLPAPLESAAELSAAAPNMLGEAGSELWDELYAQLSVAGVLKASDRAALLALCLQWDRAMLMAEVLEEQGHFSKGSMGQLTEHPALKVEARAHQLLLRFAAEYGATPVARARIAAAKRERDQVDEFEEITGEATAIEDAEIDETEL